MKKVMHKILNKMISGMLTCEKATYLISKRDYVPLSGWEKFMLKIHLMGCKPCVDFEKDNRILNQQITFINSNQDKLSSKKKELIKSLIK